jgi:hypothetical protein
MSDESNFFTEDNYHDYSMNVQGEEDDDRELDEGNSDFFSY